MGWQGVWQRGGLQAARRARRLLHAAGGGGSVASASERAAGVAARGGEGSKWSHLVRLPPARPGAGPWRRGHNSCSSPFKRLHCAPVRLLARPAAAMALFTLVTRLADGMPLVRAHRACGPLRAWRAHLYTPTADGAPS
jgi:hypothetical protein